MTAAMLVLEPIFEADLPPEQYAYRPGRNAQQAVVEVEDVLFRSHPDVVDADLGLLREHPSCRTAEVSGAPHRRSARVTSDQAVAGVLCRRNRQTRPEDAHHGGQGQPLRHPSGLTHLTAAGESLYAPVRVGMEEARARAKPWQSDRDLR